MRAALEPDAIDQVVYQLNRALVVGHLMRAMNAELTHPPSLSVFSASPDEVSGEHAIRLGAVAKDAVGRGARQSAASEEGLLA